MTTFSTQCQQAANAYRLGKEAEASEVLICLLDALPHHLSPDTLGTAAFAQLVNDILQAKNNRNHHYLADLLAYELAAWGTG